MNNVGQNINPQVPVYIFDLDGTLALIEHRRHLVEPPTCGECAGAGAVPSSNPKYYPDPVRCADCNGRGKLKDGFKADWDAFFEDCDKDLPNLPVIQTLHHLAINNEIWIWSGRSDKVWNKTRLWLNEHVKFRNELRMREENDFTPDVILKKSWLDSLPPEQRKRIVAVFDDRDGVVQMWRDNGIACFQVAPGNF